jgi:hypothetical protein
MFYPRFCSVAVASLAACVAAAFAQPEQASPIIGAEAADGVREVSLDSDAVASLRAQDREFTLVGFPMPSGGSVELVLEPLEVLTPEAAIVIGTEHGDFEIGTPDVSLFRGSVAGDPGSVVFLSFSPHGTHGVIRSQGSTSILTSGPSGADLPMVIADLASFPEPPDFAKGWSCNVGPEHVNPLGLDLDHLAHNHSGFGQRNNPCRVARIAVDSDFEYTSLKFGGDPEAAAAYAITLLGAVSEIYTRDLNVRLVVPFVRVWDENVDPYDGGNLDLFRAEWNANMRHVERDLAHKLSGNYGGGVAWVSVLCHNTYGYGLSGVNGSFPYPLRDHDGGNWDLMVVAHELGHNFGTLHTHDGYDPVIDDCGNGDCSDAYGGTIMSYCHTCPGGMNNIVIGFHPRVITHVSAYLDGACDLTGDSRIFVYDDQAVALQDAEQTIDVLANDQPVNCSTLEIVSVSGFSQQGGTVEISTGTGEGGRDEVIYAPPTGYSGEDRLFYSAENAGGFQAAADVYLDVVPVRDAVAIGASRPGLAADYYFLQAPEQLPDFSMLTPDRTGTWPDLNIENGSGAFAGSGRSLNVGAVFHSALHIPGTGLYTLSIESDDGSKLFIGDDLLIDNDGLHGMQERGASVGLEAGFHRLRVEYFQRFSNRGLVVRIEGAGLPRQPIPAGMWRNDRCIADWTFDGDVNTIDFLIFLADWNLREPAADLNADGLVNSQDVVLFLNAWVAGC